MTFAAEIVNGRCVRVIVGSPEWAAEHLGGEWVHTRNIYNPVIGMDESDPENPVPIIDPVEYAGIGHVYDDTFPERFAPPWVPPTPDPETGEWSWYPKGAVHGHAGRLWKSTTDRNVWVPGETGWHPEPDIEGMLPDWIQPTGAHDTWWLGAEVAHAGKRWESLIPNNTTAPGSDPRWWRDMDPPETPAVEAWKPWPGFGPTYGVGSEVLWTDGHVYRSRIANNTWSPAQYPAGWERVT